MCRLPCFANAWRTCNDDHTSTRVVCSVGPRPAARLLGQRAVRSAGLITSMNWIIKPSGRRRRCLCSEFHLQFIIDVGDERYAAFGPGNLFFRGIDSGCRLVIA